ncbi:MAG: AAA family ATPase [Acidobacteria bacterium]|nr:AAA family ATPase [Acidobacteriota bacterium]
MYKDHFSLKEYPFSLTPDPKFIVFTPSYNELLAGLYYGIEMAKGLIVLTGEVGTGKTTALRWLIRRLDSSVRAAYIFNPHLSIDEFYHHVTEMLDITDYDNKTDMLLEMGKMLEDRHRRGLRTLLIVDEAHEISDEVMEEIRLLLNFESDSAKHLQIILTGQPELRERLRQKNLRQLKQRVALRCEMPILPNIDEVTRYITERMMLAGSSQKNIFTQEAIDFVYQCSEGIPRLINNLCDNALIAAFAANEKKVTREMIEEVAANLDLLPDKDALIASDRAADRISSRILTTSGVEELLSDKGRKTGFAASENN